MYKIFSCIFIMILNIQGWGQNNYGNNWLFGIPTTSEISGTHISFGEQFLDVSSIQKEMDLEGSVAVMSNSNGELLFYSNGCYIANRNHELMINGDSIGQGFLESSFCQTGGNPLTQGIIALPAPEDTSKYFLFYTDFSTAYDNTGEYFPLAPLKLYYSLIDMNEDNGKGAVISKNQLVIADTLARSMIQAYRHDNGQDWWIVYPKSHSNCYHTILLSAEGIDTTFLQCVGTYWGDRDAQGQATFSPNGSFYSRANYFYGINLFHFDNSTGLFSEPLNIPFQQDTFYFSGTVFSPNSRFLYITAYSKILQFDVTADDIAASKLVIAELDTPNNINFPTRFNQANLGSDGRIYIAGTTTHTYLHIIHSPNCEGIDADIEQYALEMPAYNSYSMPNIPHYDLSPEQDSCITVSTNSFPKEQNQKLLTIFPNPTSGSLHIKSEDTFDINITDLRGKSFFYMKEINQELELDISYLPKGTYLLKIRWTDKVLTEKIIKI